MNNEINYSFVTDIPPMVSMDELRQYGRTLKTMLDANHAEQRKLAIELLHKEYPETDLKQAETFTIGSVVYCFEKYHFIKHDIVISIICRRIKKNGQSTVQVYPIFSNQFHLIQKLS